MAQNTIKLKKYSDVIEEYEAGGTITPGMLLKMNSNGKVVAHDSAGGNVNVVMFALENALEGKGIGDNYSSGDRVQVWIPYRGDEVYAILKDGENVSVGDPLESAGDGSLQKHVADTVQEGISGSGEVPIYGNQIVAIALEALDLSGSSSEPVSERRIKVKIV